MAGFLAAKKRVPYSSGTLRTDNLTFAFMLLGTVLLVGALSFMPAVVLGPVADHLMQGQPVRADRSPRGPPVLFRTSNHLLSRKKAYVSRDFHPDQRPPAIRGRGSGLQAAAAARPAALASSILRWSVRPRIRSFVMLDPRSMMRNPVMFLVEVGTVLTAIVTVQSIVTGAATGLIVYQAALTFLLLLTVLFANFAEALAEARGKAQADSLRATRQDTLACRLDSLESQNGEYVPSTKLRSGDLVLVEAGEVIPADGEVVDGVASVDESAITGESAPVIREAGGDRSGVTGGTRVLSDRIIVQVTAEAGQSFLDRMIALVEGAIRQKTPNEIALTIVLAAFSLIFLIVTAALYPMARYFDLTLDIPTLIALLVCLIPTTIGALLAAIGIAGMDRALMANIIAKSGKAVELAGDIDTLLLDKTGHDHHRQSASHPVRPARRRLGPQPGAAGRAGLAGRHHARRQEHPRPGPARGSLLDGEVPARGQVHRVHRADPDERHRPSRRHAGSAREHPTPLPGTSRSKAEHSPTATRRPSIRSHPEAPRRWPWPRTIASSAWSSSKTSSSRASASGSPGSARWGCAWSWSQATTR